MKKLAILVLSITMMSCGGDSGEESTETIELDQTKPQNVMNAIFDAAKSGDYAVLKTLCDPLGENDGDTQQICDCGNSDVDPEILASFKEYFSKGKVVGDTKMIVDEAEVDFTFGPDGDKSETMRMIERDGKWYLSSF